MILNEHQYKVSRNAMQRFDKELRELKKQDIKQLRIKIQIEALEADIKKLRYDLEEYDAIKSGKVKVFELNGLHELSTALIKARVARNLTQQALAEVVGVQTQQIQRYESTNYESASFSKLKQIADALNLKIKETISL